MGPTRLQNLNARIAGSNGLLLMLLLLVLVLAGLLPMAVAAWEGLAFHSTALAALPTATAPARERSRRG